MDQADQLPELTPAPPDSTGSASSLLLTLAGLLGVLTVGAGMTAYGLYRIWGSKSRRTPRPSHQPTRPAKSASPASQPRPSVPVTAKQRDEISRLIGALGHDDYARRSAAHRRLIQIGPAARASLEAARDHPDEEVRWRVRAILRQLDKRG